MKNLNNKVVAITGAASGIGKELATQLAKRGVRLALNDWNKNDLAIVIKELEHSGAEVIGFPFDIRNRESWQSFADKIESRFGHLDILINNAGVVHHNSHLEKIPVDVFSKVLDINMWGAFHGTQIMIPLLKKRPESSLIHINSSFGLMAYPGLGAYTMSKFALRGLTETLQLEYRNHKDFHIMSVHPGGVRTNLVRNMKCDDPEHLAKLAAIFDKQALSTPEQVALKVIKGIEKKKTRVIIGKDSRYMDIITRLFPRSYYFLLKLSSKMQVKKEQEPDTLRSIEGKSTKLVEKIASE